RRHTRFSRDWSSDVCSSDLAQGTKVHIRSKSECALKRSAWKSQRKRQWRSGSSQLWPPKPRLPVWWGRLWPGIHLFSFPYTQLNDCKYICSHPTAQLFSKKLLTLSVNSIHFKD